MRALAIAILSVLIVPWAALAHEDHHGAAATTGGLGPVEVGAAARERLGIETVTVAPGTVERATECYGTIEPKPDRVFWASPRFAGRVVGLHFDSGQSVREGDVLAEVESRSVAERPVVVPLRSRIDGTVVERRVAIGEPVEPSAVLYRVTDLSSVLVRCNVFELDAAEVAVGQPARVFTQAFGTEPLLGRVTRVGGSLAEASATLPVWIEIENQDGRLRPGVSVHAAIVTRRAENVTSVPRSAVLGSAGNLFVFLDRGGDVFAGALIGVGLRGERALEITSGLLPGDRVVTVGAYELQFLAGENEDPHDDHEEHDDHAHEDEDEDEHGHDHGHEEEAPLEGVRLSAVAQANLDLRVEPVGYKDLEEVVECVGSVVPAPRGAHRISTRTAGRVAAVHVLEGEAVSEGRLLAEIETNAVADPPPVVKVYASRDGVVTERHVFLGEPVTPEKTLFTVASLSELLVNCHMPEADMGKVGAGAQVTVESPALPGRAFSGQVAYLDGELHRETGSVHTYIALEGSSKGLLPNMRVRGYIRVGGGERVVAVARAALLRSEDGRTEVFVRSGDRFMRQPVRVGRYNLSHAEVRNGLLPGDLVVTRGADALRFASDSPEEPEG